MKRTIALTLCLLLMCAGWALGEAGAPGKIVILATDGTIVIAGAGAGEFSKAFEAIINELSIPLVISSRIDDGIIIPENLLCENTIAADNLSPQKAAILLRLALTQTTDRDRIQQMFFEY